MLSVDKVSDTYFPAKPQEQKRRILVLDDDVDILNLVQDAFRHYGFEIDAYPNPDVALSMRLWKVRCPMTSYFWTSNSTVWTDAEFTKNLRNRIQIQRFAFLRD